MVRYEVFERRNEEVLKDLIEAEIIGVGVDDIAEVKGVA